MGGKKLLLRLFSDPTDVDERLAMSSESL